MAGLMDDYDIGGLMRDIEEPRNMITSYNTKLTPEEERVYREWAIKNGYDPFKGTYDYDLRGAWKAGEGKGGNGHMTDRFKKPNHPTFSRESQYEGAGGVRGGWWEGLNGGRYAYHYNPSNMYTPQELETYFRQVEPGNSIVWPMPLPRPMRKNK